MGVIQSLIAKKGIIITQTPFRISFFGGGTDFPKFFCEYEGAVLGTAITKYVYISLNSLVRFFEKKIRLSYSRLECVDYPHELEHNIVRALLNKQLSPNEDEFFDIHTFADLPASSGVGSSSSFTVGMLNALNSLNGFYKTKKNIAEEAIHIERVELQESGGWQDQIFAAYGGFNLISFNKNGFYVEPICISQEKKQALEKSCLLFFTGQTRSSAEMQTKAMILNDQEQCKVLLDMKKLTHMAFETLHLSKTSDELVNEFGKLLDESWQYKRSLSNHISNDRIELMYEQGRKAGAIGGKLCGAGGGGFILFIVNEKNKNSVKDALKEYKHMDLTFENQGSKIIYSQHF